MDRLNRDRRGSVAAMFLDCGRGALLTIAAVGMLNPAAGQLVSSWDDGSAERSIILVAGSEYRPTLWLNGFEAHPGGEVITSIAVTWGVTTGASSGVPEHAPTTVLLYQDDPSNDGDPRSATLLVSVPLDNGAPLGSIDTGVFLDVPIPATLVRGTFFVAALYPDPGEGFPAPLDTSDPDFPGRSWVFSNAEDAVNTVNLSANFGGLIENPPFGLSGNWLLRAVGRPAHGDLDADGDVDLSDYLQFVDCVGGPNNDPPASACAVFDFDDDLDVDMIDFGWFQRAFTGG